MAERTCQKCQITIQVPKTSCAKWCDECRLTLRRERGRLHDAKRRPRPTHHLQCHHCKIAFEHSGKGQVPKYCRTCRGTRPGVHEQYRVRPAYAKGTSRKHHLKSKYGLSQADWEALFDSQGRRCVICRTSDPGKQWHTDHDHKTGRVRGILCRNCNVGIGHFAEDVDRLRAAIHYLVPKPSGLRLIQGELAS